MGSSLLHVGRSGGYASPPMRKRVASGLGIGRGNGGPSKARKTESRFPLPFPRPWKSQSSALSTFRSPRLRLYRCSPQTQTGAPRTPRPHGPIPDPSQCGNSKDRIPRWPSSSSPTPNSEEAEKPSRERSEQSSAKRIFASEIPRNTRSRIDSLTLDQLNLETSPESAAYYRRSPPYADGVQR